MLPPDPAQNPKGIGKNTVAQGIDCVLGALAYRPLSSTFTGSVVRCMLCRHLNGGRLPISKQFIWPWRVLSNWEEDGRPGRAC